VTTRGRRDIVDLQREGGVASAHTVPAPYDRSQATRARLWITPRPVDNPHPTG
jgi:hypothetical protein